MSSKRGNVHRSRPQKYQNTTAFKNDLHDKSVQTKRINSLQISEVCPKCKKVIEWKIKYKKFKPLKAATTCVSCLQRNVKHAYHTLCAGCANTKGVCPKCGLKGELVTKEKTLEERLQLDREMQDMLKSLPERKRRTFLRYVQKMKEKKKSQKNEESKDVLKPDVIDISNPGDDEDSDAEDKKYLTKDDLLAKLNNLKLSCKNDGSDDDDWGSEFDDIDDDDELDDDDDELDDDD